MLCVTVQQPDILQNSMFTSAAVDQEAAEADEGIGESETDVASNTDADASCPSVVSSYCQQQQQASPASTVSSSLPTHVHTSVHSASCSTASCDNHTSRSYACGDTSAVSSGNLSQNNAGTHPSDQPATGQSCTTDDTEMTEQRLELHNCQSSQTCDVPTSASTGFDEPGD